MYSSKPQAQKGPDTMFIMKPTPAAEYALEKWLKTKEFNDFNDGWEDKKGNPGIGLQKAAGNGNKRSERVAVIICLDGSEQIALHVVNKHLGFGA